MDGSINWELAAEHMWQKHRLLSTWAQEAVLDPAAIYADPDPASKSGHAIRIIGFSRSAQAVLVVILVRERQRLVAATAWRANPSHIRRYEQGRSSNVYT